MQICKVWEWSNENCEVYQLSQFFLVEMKSEPTDTGLNEVNHLDLEVVYIPQVQ